jgi:acyl-phosphate glycerol 3-phosphate acyltransferase
MTFLSLAAVALPSYLLGAVPFGYLIARARGVDILRVGSGNIGATNVGRVLGRPWGVLVFLLDFAKGALPVLAALLLADQLGAPPEGPAVAAGVSAFLGHLFPVYLRFRGGKGVATAAGVVAMLVPGPALGAALTWAVVVTATRYVSLASLAAAAMLCGLRVAAPGAWDGPQHVISWFCVAAAALVVARHHANVRRLLNGTENRLKERAAMSRFSKALHLLALGLWLGSIVLFVLVGYTLFTTSMEVARAQERPWWLPPPQDLPRKGNVAGLATPSAEQGGRLFGHLTSRLVPLYYGLQLGCALVATITALSWAAQRRGKAYRLRAWLVGLALLTLLAGLWLGRVINDTRKLRNDYMEKVLFSPEPDPDDVALVLEARAALRIWYTVRLLQNLVTLLLVGTALALCAWLPEERQGDRETGRQGDRETEEAEHAVA